MQATGSSDEQLRDQLRRRDVIRQAAAVAAVGALSAGAAPSASASASAGVSTDPVAPAAPAALDNAPLDIAEYSWKVLGVQRATLARGTVPDGGHLYVEYQIPAQVRHPYPILLIHGGNGQGLDWMGTPDGRRGWASYLLEQGYKVYVADRPGQGRPYYDPGLFGDFHEAPTYERVAAAVSSSQWPGTGKIGDAALDQFVASLGPAFPDTGEPFIATETAQAHSVWRTTGAKVLDDIGPCIVVTHGDSSPFAWLMADERPKLVKGIVAIEPSGPAFEGVLKWGLTASRISFDPPVATSDEIAITPPIQPAMQEAGLRPYRLQADPPRRLKNLIGVPIAILTAEGSPGNQRDAGTVAFLRQAGCTVEHLRLGELGVHGNGPYLMLEKNNREALQPVLAWMDRKIANNGTAPAAPAVPRAVDSTAMKLADQGYFWTGVARRKVPYGTVAAGQMFVQYFIPEKIRYPHAIVLIHGGGGQAHQFMGIGQRPGWIHYFVQEGYRVYCIDRPGSGRSPYHPDTFDRGLVGRLARLHLGVFASYEGLMGVFRTPQWPGNGEIGDPTVDQFVTLEITTPQGEEKETTDAEVFLEAGTALLDRIGPAVVHSFAYSGQLGWILADRRPALVKGVITIEPDGFPFDADWVLKWGVTSIPVAYDPPVSHPSQLALVDVKPPPDNPDAKVYQLQAEPARRLKNLVGIPVCWITGDLRAKAPSRYNGPAGVAFLRQAGVTADHLKLSDYGITGNGNVMSLESNNKQIFGVMRDWLAKSVAAPSDAA
jgi:pimeloyl-ACP methyl ester carboxylesterase